MPYAAKKPCNKPGCGKLTNNRYCDQHTQDKSNYQHTKTVTQRGYGHAWRKLRRIVLARDKYLCQLCLKSGRVTEAQVVDHITPKAKGGTDNLDNLQSLCNHCHDHKTATEDSKG
jgi:5-methylcytosine-specific restriction protein A